MNRELDQQAIRELAYRIWESGGRRPDSSDHDWLQAENELLSAHLMAHHSESAGVDESLEETFPASDPPSTHLPDVPPVNAEDKWAAAAEAQADEARVDRSLKKHGDKLRGATKRGGPKPHS